MILLSHADPELFAPSFLAAAFARGLELHLVDDDPVVAAALPDELRLSWLDPVFDPLRGSGRLRERRARLVNLLGVLRGPERRRLVRWLCPAGSLAVVPGPSPSAVILIDLSAGRATVETPSDPGWSLGHLLPHVRLTLGGHQVTVDAEVEAGAGRLWRLRFPPRAAPDDGRSAARVNRLIYRARRSWVEGRVAEARSRRLFFRA